MRKYYIVPSLEEIKLDAPVLMTGASKGVDVDSGSEDTDPDSDRSSSYFGTCIFDDTE